MLRATLLIVTVISAGLYLLNPNDAECLDCITAGQPCYGSAGCLEGCFCYRPEGLGKPGFCG